MYNQQEITHNYFDMTGNEPRQPKTINHNSREFTDYWKRSFEVIDNLFMEDCQ